MGAFIGGQRAHEGFKKPTTLKFRKKYKSPLESRIPKKNYAMKKLILSLALLSYIIDTRAEKTYHITDSLRSLLKTAQNDSTRVKTLNSLSGYLILADKYDSALVVANEALSLSQKIGYESGMATSYRKLGVNYTQMGDYARAIECLFKSLQINERLNNKEEIFKLNNNMGNAYYSQGNYTSALAYFMKAYAYNKNDGLTNANIGNTYIEKNNFSVALTYLNRALVAYRMVGDEYGVSDVLNSMGTAYEYSNSDSLAIVCYLNSLKIKEAIGDVQGQSDLFGGVGDILFRQKKYVASMRYENKSLELAKSIAYLMGIQQTEKKLSDIYDAVGNKNLAYLHYRRYISIRDSLYNEEQTKKTVRAEMNFDFDKKQAIEKAVHNEELKHQRTIRNSFIAGFVLVVIFSLFIFRGYKKTRKQKHIIEIQKKIVEDQQKEVGDNINYAAKLQRAMLPSEEYINKNLPNNLLIFMPKDVVSGDFYYQYSDEQSTYFASADATGHGVSGSLMGSLANSLLNEILIERKITSPEIILNTLRSDIIKSLNQSGADEERKDGVDISFCKITGMKLECALANNPVYIIRKRELFELKPDRFPVGKYITNLPFNLKTFDLQKNDLIFTFSDGFSDQFNSETGKKLMSKRFKEWLIELSDLEMSKIKLELQSRFHAWKGSEHQIDDVTVFGVRI